KAPDIGQQGDAECAALRDDADIAGETSRIAQLLQVGRAAIVRVEHSHAVWPAQCNTGVAADLLDAGLEFAPLVAALGKSAIIDHGTLRSALGGSNDRIENTGVADTKHGNIGRLG